MRLLRDIGLEQAITSAGGVRALSRALGLSQPAISNWKRVPADRVVAVEGLTGIARAVLRPDLYEGEPIMLKQDRLDLDPLDAARADVYQLIGALLWRTQDAAALAEVSKLRGNATKLGLAQIALAEFAAQSTPEAVRDEFFALFIGVGRGELLPYASFYLTGFLNERPLVAVRDEMVRLGLSRAERINEPEDHIAILFDVMAGLIRGDYAADGLDDQIFFDRHLKPWAARFFADLETAVSAHVYKPLGRLGGVFIDIETEAYRLPV
jgi:TorA maturation chaperone TorD